MKTGYYLGGLALGLILGGSIGYLIATDPKKRRKINDFFSDLNDKVTDLGEKVKFVKDRYCDCVEKEVEEIESILDNEKS